MHGVIMTTTLIMFALIFGGCGNSPRGEVNRDVKIKSVHKIKGHDGTNLNKDKIDITQMAPPDRRRTVEGLTGRSINEKINTDLDSDHTDLKGRKLF